MIDNIFRRVIAYVMDMILVSIVVSSIISAKVVNFQIDEYNKKYDEYNELYNLYIEQHSNKIENCDDLEKAIEEEKLREEKYVEDLDKLKDSLSKQDITKEEYSDKVYEIKRKTRSEFSLCVFVLLFRLSLDR